MKLSLDTETTGLDPYFDTLPFLVTTCNDNKNYQTWWHWKMDPITRIPIIPLEDIYEMYELFKSCSVLILQNAKYDLQVLDNLIRKGLTGSLTSWDWDFSKIHDTSISAHLIASCQPKNLTAQSLIYLGIDMQSFEDRIKKATDKARRIVGSKSFKEEVLSISGYEWFLSKKGAPGMPSAGSEPWKGDMFLPKTLVELMPQVLPDWEDWHQGDPPEVHPWNTVLEDYAHPDSEATLLLFEKHQELIKEKDLVAIYEERRKLIKICYNMEHTGVTLNATRLNSQVKEYTSESEVCQARCINLAPKEFELTKLPINGASNALRKTVFEGFQLESSLKSKKTGQPSLKAVVIDEWLQSLDSNSKAYRFIKNLADYRKRKTAIGYMESYKRYWKSIGDDWYLLHPSINPTGTNTLRWSSARPNEQNISKKEGFNLRYSFGPTPGRLWASLDYNNIELRIPAYESGEKVMIEIFEKPNDPPFFGSYHLMNASMIFSDEFWPLAEQEGAFKAKYKALYGRTKNFGFAVSYGAVLKKNGWGTADKAAGKRGAHSMVVSKLKKHSELNERWIQTANATGFVETIPDREIDPNKGYPIECSRTSYNKISPTIPLNYHVQSTCMWVIFRAMIKIQSYLDDINVGLAEEDHWVMAMQVHDEIVLDFPQTEGWETHLRNIVAIMEKCGDLINIPLTVGCEIHEENWSTGYELAMAT